MVIPHSRAGCLRVTHPCATFHPGQALSFSFDLHVLSPPPAFVLSQDQTLRSKRFETMLERLLAPILLWRVAQPRKAVNAPEIDQDSLYFQSHQRTGSGSEIRIGRRLVMRLVRPQFSLRRDLQYTKTYQRLSSIVRDLTGSSRTA